MSFVVYRRAKLADGPAIRVFVDFWITGVGKRLGVKGASHDCFITLSRHEKYIRQYSVLLAFYAGRIVGWAVKQKNETLVHMLVAGDFRGMGVGAEMLRILDPPKIRSKFDQGTGDPIAFYLQRGYVKEGKTRVGKHLNIDVLVKKKR